MSQVETADDIARRSAARLVDIDPQMPQQVERALAEDPFAEPVERVIDPISLGTLIVTIASAGWTIYHDIKRDRATAGLDELGKIKRLREQLLEAEIGDVPSDLTLKQRVDHQRRCRGGRSFWLKIQFRIAVRLANGEKPSHVTCDWAWPGAAYIAWWAPGVPFRGSGDGGVAGDFTSERKIASQGCLRADRELVARYGSPGLPAALVEKKLGRNA